MLTRDLVRTLLEYLPDGRLLRKGKTRPIKIAQDRASTVRINKKTYLAHRVVWLWHHGTWPECIDHINGDFRDNRIENLREASLKDNMGNRRKRSKTQSSSFKGVSIRQAGTRGLKTTKYDASCAGQYLGSFNTAEEAAKAYDVAALEYFGEFACINYPKENYS